MKHIFFLASLFMIMGSANDSTGQGISYKSFHYSDPPRDAKAIPASKKNTKSGISRVNASQFNKFVLSHKIQFEVRVTSVHIKAVRDFTRVHPQTADAKWFKTEAGYLASFLSKGIFTKVAYDNDGRWLYNLLEYTEHNMGFEIRDMVKGRYYDYTIEVIHQYEFDNGKTVYLLRMQDRQSNIVTLKVCNEEMELLAPGE